ncbi:cytochrome p450 [Moniliophthora roreri]|nr:cytochrome p450 [Moniliophthora roreri]
MRSRWLTQPAWDIDERMWISSGIEWTSDSIGQTSDSSNIIDAHLVGGQQLYLFCLPNIFSLFRVNTTALKRFSASAVATVVPTDSLPVSISELLTWAYRQPIYDGLPIRIFESTCRQTSANG